ncbi:MAG TPA: RnfABCDGE type electron transport complex subunit D [Chthonomonadaceae bacterium]|nr:RnfABCDGE type electron transport complex subunit D [Chthonomonadaceae bacterium]
MSDVNTPAQEAAAPPTAIPPATSPAPTGIPPAAAGTARPDGAAARRLAPKPVPTMFGIDARFVPPILITMILLAGQLRFHYLESWHATALAITTSIVTDAILGRIFTGKWPHLASAYITGISVGILVRSNELWPFALCSAISITSKYVIRWRGRHLWNPSNFGICMMLLLARDTVATLGIQWGNDLLPMVVVWIVGSMIIWRIKRFHITATYVVSFFAFAFLRSAITHDPWQSEVAAITGPMYQLYIFFMITDPKSTVMTKRGQAIVAFLVAAVECCLRLVHHFAPAYDELSIHAPYYALFIVGPIANFIEIVRTPVNAAPKP